MAEFMSPSSTDSETVPVVTVAALAQVAEVLKAIAKDSPRRGVADLATVAAIAFTANKLVAWAHGEAKLAPVAPPWFPASTPPALTESPYGRPMSKPVLGQYLDGTFAVVTCEDGDYPKNATVWRTTCSGRWDITGRVARWQPVRGPQVPGLDQQPG